MAVVRAGFEADNAVDLIPACREHHDRLQIARSSKVPADGQSVFVCLLPSMLQR
jgi:hypothetical protein